MGMALSRPFKKIVGRQRVARNIAWRASPAATNSAPFQGWLTVVCFGVCCVAVSVAGPVALSVMTVYALRASL